MKGLDRELNKLLDLSIPSAVLSAGQGMWRPFSRLSHRQRSSRAYPYRRDALEAAAKLEDTAGKVGFGIENRQLAKEMRRLAREFREHSESEL